MPHSLSSRQSAYYPPRAGGMRLPWRMLSSLRLRRHLERIHLPPLRSFLKTLAAVVVPGLAFRFMGPRLVARIIWIALPILMLVFVMGLGTFVSEAAFAMIIGAHVTSVSHLLRPLMIRNRIALQMVFGVVLFLAASVFIYVPAREWFHSHVALALSVHEQVVIINPRASAASVGRGDLVVYRFETWARDGVIVRAGMGLQPVIAVPGDRLVFGEGTVQVNRSPQRLPASARRWGSFIVPEHCWFIWPELDISNRGVVAGSVEAALRGLALVDQGQFVGRPYRWWFFRDQDAT